jgi:pyridoxamine 5'-phosphate oxidase
MGELTIEETSQDPINQFNGWFEEAHNEDEKEANAMIISTIDHNGFPDSRTVLLKEIENKKFVFYTNYESSKGKQLAANPKCNLLFLWLSLERQVRIKGTVSKLTEEQSFQYFSKRPKESQIGAWSSPQSQVIGDRNVLEKSYKTNEDKFAGVDHIPLPPFWGGYAVDPVEIEFWQGRSSRLHDRIRYRLVNNNWTKERLAP